MVNTLRSSVDILGASATRVGDIGAKASELKEAQAAVTRPEKFLSRDALDKSGLAREFDELQATLLNVKSYDTTASITSTRLSNEQNAVKQINDIMVRFEQEMSQSNSVAGSKQEKVDKALAALEVAMRSKDTSGRFIWGGKDSGTDPLSKLDANGNRVAVSLVNESNVVNGLITNNYSSVSPSGTIVTISSEHEVKEGFIHPGHEAMAKAIGYLNMVKENANAIDAGGAGAAVYTDQQLSVAQRDQIDARGELKVLIDLEVKKTEAAFDINKRDAKDAMKANNDLFSANLVERTQQVQALLTSMMALIALSNVDGKVSDTLANLRV